MRLALTAIMPLLALAGVFVAVRYLWSIAFAPNKAWRIAVMIDETANMAANGQVNQTVSRRAANARERGTRWGCVLCTLLERIDTGHCDRA